MRKLTKILIVILLAFVYYHVCISYLWHSECQRHKMKDKHMQSHMPEKLQVIYDFVKNCKLEYIEEKPGQDYWKAPYETEKDGLGDCEDLSIWLMYKLWEMGYDAWLVIGRNDYEGHMWVRARISDGRFSNYYDVDMQKRFVRHGFEEIPLTGGFRDKLEEVMIRQSKYEQGK